MGNNRIPQEQIDKIYEAHGLGMSTSVAGEYANVSHSTISRYWAKKGLKPHFNQDLTKEQIDKIYEAHELGMSSYEAGEYARTSNVIVLNYWKKEGLETHFKSGGNSKLTKEQIDKIYEAHRLGMTITKAGEYAGVHSVTVLNYWKKEGLETHFKQDLTQEQIDKIYEAHELGMSQNEATKYANVSRIAIASYWKKKGLETPFNKKNMRKYYDFTDNFVRFDSNSERIIGILLNKYGLISEFKENENLHVRTNGKRLHSLDFLVDNTFIEYHPLGINDQKKSLTLEQAGERKLENITNPEYLDNWFWHIWEIDQLYDILQDSEINPKMSEEYRNLSFEDFKGHVREAYQNAKEYDSESKLNEDRKVG